MATKNNKGPAQAGGASGGLATEPRVGISDVCKYVKRWVDDLRSDMYVAITTEKLLELMNGYLKEVGEDDLDVETVTEDDLKTCLRYDDTVRIVRTKDNVDVLLLWSGWRLYDLIDRVIETTAREGETAISVP
jgi:hypothetical protein